MKKSKFILPQTSRIIVPSFEEKNLVGIWVHPHPPAPLGQVPKFCRIYFEVPKHNIVVVNVNTHSIHHFRTHGVGGWGG